MASRAETMENVQIAISDTNEFLQDLPSYFRVGTDSKIHHEPGRVNVFSRKNDFFADAYSEVLKVESPEELALMKQRLLTLPIYMHVHLEKHRRSGNTRIITHGDYVIMVNTKHPEIAHQLREKLDEVEMQYAMDKRFALEINFGPVLRGWFQTRFEDSWGNYIARHSNFCVTNFTQRSKLCVSPLAWILCLPVCIVVAPLHCAYRAILSNDEDLAIRSTVQYVKGTTPEQRAELRNLVRAAYIQGMARTLVNQDDDRRRYEQSYNQVPAPPPSYPGSDGKGVVPAPPTYEAVVNQPGHPDPADVPMINNVI